MRRAVLVVVALLAFAVIGVAGCYFATGGSAFHTSAIRIRVIDALTERPVAGALLAAQWQTSAFLCIEGDCPRTIVRTAEALSDHFGITCLLHPPTSSKDAARKDQATAAVLGDAPWQWSPDRFPRLAAAVRNAQP